MVASCRLMDDELLQCSQEEGVTMANSVETLGVDLRPRVKKDAQNEILAHQRRTWFSKRAT